MVKWINYLLLKFKGIWASYISILITVEYVREMLFIFLIENNLEILSHICLLDYHFQIKKCLLKPFNIATKRTKLVLQTNKGNYKRKKNTKVPEVWSQQEMF